MLLGYQEPEILLELIFNWIFCALFLSRIHLVSSLIWMKFIETNKVLCEWRLLWRCTLFQYLRKEIIQHLSSAYFYRYFQAFEVDGVLDVVQNIPPAFRLAAHHAVTKELSRTLISFGYASHRAIYMWMYLAYNERIHQNTSHCFEFLVENAVDLHTLNGLKEANSRENLSKNASPYTVR